MWKKDRQFFRANKWHFSFLLYQKRLASISARREIFSSFTDRFSHAIAENRFGMDILLLSFQKKIISALSEGETGSDSLLIPMCYWNRLNELQKKALSKKLPFLLKRYTKYIASCDRLHWKADKVKYNRGLKKMTIHVNTGVWAVLGVLAAAHGVSRCFLFNYLLWLEDSGIGNSIVDTMNRGVPQFHGTYKMSWTLNLQKNQIFRTLFFKPNPITSKHLFSLPKPDL